MFRLAKRELLNAGLVRLTPHLVARYNECLLSAGGTPIEGDHIEIDGVGMSPQVAAQRGNPYYLSNGFANPLALIICPEQYNKPVFYPIFSWQRALMRAFFDKYHRQIVDVTGTHAISIELDTGLSSLESPEDLLLLTQITATPHLEDIAAAAARQAELVHEFSQGLACLEESLCDRLVESRKIHGDLRKRRISMEPMSFASFADFYTAAFGGAAVLRDVDGVDLLVLASEEVYEKLRGKRKKPSAQAFYLYDEEFPLLDVLTAAKWVSVPLDRYREDPKILEYQKELLLADALCDCDKGIDWRSLTNAARKALAQKHKDKVPEMYFELERFAAAFRNGTTREISKELEIFLAEPSTLLPPQTQEVVWTLLTHREPRNLLALYTVDKNAFLKLYSTWSDAKREWAASYLAARYKHKHRLSQLQE